MLPPGSTIGILGGGQLGRMMAVPAAQLGYRCIGFAPEGDNVAGDLCADFITADWDDAAALAEFARRCDVITWEFENVPVAAVEQLPQAKVPCPPRALEIAQDRLLEKNFVEELGGRAAPFAAVDDAADLRAAAARIGTPGILKTRRDGYDGKGQWRIEAAADLDSLELPGDSLIYEGFVRFEAEFSVIVARAADGAVRFYDSTHNEHRGGILARSALPAPAIVGKQVEEARDLARKVADALGYVGVLTLEFFACADGPVFNEMAPRVHNSGHWTIEGAVTSQFANHIRAVAGLPLGETTPIAPRIAMDNIIGDAVENAADYLTEAGCHLHLYGKEDVRDGRKMGHVTRLFRNAEQA
ncbi:5-(carboxyamino)imidazole ribonucleotide synthase [Qipengyuania atrilutea]|uniref:N5-carboxyaminoimidazole ribonucleotide synthase n=1 Tax=Qipengyuania atrilutea TaxID=2744473 RepID=A0A850H3K4_9SPHN|nr:5-(carboxyamino)imidazole ribonucleotide synthase [Actirhodobacter atriluteus]NVD45137.1 5-(carboxyamino)imidazole ribonucleotide synthase [Actirhodobacter atriluteus]